MDDWVLTLFGALYAVAAAIGAVVDVRTRSLPNGLAFVLAAFSFAYAGRLGGASMLAVRIGTALLVSAFLVCFELLWRRSHGAAGLGMGDVKALFSLLVLDPGLALLSFSVGLLALAVAASFRGVSSLPFLPFLFGALAVASLLSYGGGASEQVGDVGALCDDTCKVQMN